MPNKKPLFFLVLFLLTFFVFLAEDTENSKIARRYLDKAIEYISSGSTYSEALKFCNLAIKHDPGLAEAYYRRAEVKMGLTGSSGIMEDYNKAISLKPDYVWAYYSRAYLKSQQKDYKGALDDYGKCIELDPDFFRAYKKRGFLRFQLKKTGEAIEDFTQVIRLNPNDEGGYYLRGMALFKSGNYKPALKDFDMTLKLDKGDYMAKYYRGLIHFYLKNYKAAIKDLDYVEIHLGDKEKANVLYIRGMAKIHMKFPRSGCKELEEAAKLGHKEAVNAVKKYCPKK